MTRPEHSIYNYKIMSMIARGERNLINKNLFESKNSKSHRLCDEMNSPNSQRLLSNHGDDKFCAAFAQLSRFVSAKRKMTHFIES